MLKNIQIGYEANKLKALIQYMDKKEVTLQSELSVYLDKLYEKYVPVQVREFIQSVEEDNKNSKANTKRKSRTGNEDGIANY